LELGGAASRTLDQYERDLSRGCLMYPQHAIGEWTDTELLHVARDFKPAERRVRVAAWRSFFKWARQTRRVTENPTETLPAIKRRPQKVYNIFTEAEIALLTGLGSPDGTLMALLIDAGLRKSEARHFRLRHFRPDPSEAMPWGSVVVESGKGGKDREIRATKRIGSGIAELHITEGLRDSGLPLVRTPRERGQSQGAARPSDRRGHFSPLVAALPGRDGSPLPQPAHDQAHVCGELAAGRGPTRAAVAGNGP
jgi:integrase